MAAHGLHDYGCHILAGICIASKYPGIHIVIGVNFSAEFPTFEFSAYITANVPSSEFAVDVAAPILFVNIPANVPAPELPVAFIAALTIFQFSVIPRAKLCVFTISDHFRVYVTVDLPAAFAA
ncbi:hypothetical protein EW026_g7206 [Hermanssonia centrifuga]|uniref:Uncharacterized protein n=1 Tax=Hermanssonia centrifuga TaxID=98765 RepID=A0A4S4KD12_9APHY|nr:hypothetical protein EW026_g7206 [Hermanssonia centrifuga]